MPSGTKIRFRGDYGLRALRPSLTQSMTSCGASSSPWISSYCSVGRMREQLGSGASASRLLCFASLPVAFRVALVPRGT